MQQHCHGSSSSCAEDGPTVPSGPRRAGRTLFSPRFGVLKLPKLGTWSASKNDRPQSIQPLAAPLPPRLPPMAAPPTSCAPRLPVGEPPRASRRATMGAPSMDRIQVSGHPKADQKGDPVAVPLPRIWSGLRRASSIVAPRVFPRTFSRYRHSFEAALLEGVHGMRVFPQAAVGHSIGHAEGRGPVVHHPGPRVHGDIYLAVLPGRGHRLRATATAAKSLGCARPTSGRSGPGTLPAAASSPR